MSEVRTVIKKEEFNSLINKLCLAFDFTISQERLDLYYSRLKWIELSKFEEYVDEWIDNENNFPTIADIQRRAEGWFK